MKLQLPRPVATFFEVGNGAAADALRPWFADDAVVDDEHRDHNGPEAITQWLLEARRRYAYHAQPLSSRQQGSRVTVGAKVTGAFPGSPVLLTHDFWLSADGRIERLAIRA